MANPKDILVITTSSIQDHKIKQYLKPISAHVVAGTNIFSDALADLTDIFGGRSKTYQNQLAELYNKAIEQIKIAAAQLGANCVVGLSIDMDEISGKGKSMFMLTAVGTAVIIEKENDHKSIAANDRTESISAERLTMLGNKKAIVEHADAGRLKLTDDIWSFITANQVQEVFPYLVKQYGQLLVNELEPLKQQNFYNLLIGYIDNLPEDTKVNVLYDQLDRETSYEVACKVCEIIKSLQLFNAEKVIQLLNSENFDVRKFGVRIATYDMPYYNTRDIQRLQSIENIIRGKFPERGKRSTKKQLLSSKEKEIWTCECGRINEIDAYCGNCNNDINGFTATETKPDNAATYLKTRIEFLTDALK